MKKFLKLLGIVGLVILVLAIVMFLLTALGITSTTGDSYERIVDTEDYSIFQSFHGNTFGQVCVQNGQDMSQNIPFIIRLDSVPNPRPGNRYDMPRVLLSGTLQQVAGQHVPVALCTDQQLPDNSRITVEIRGTTYSITFSNSPRGNVTQGVKA